jgi:predicted membrane protein
MKQSVKIVLGLALIAAGILWALNILGILSFDFSTEGWWTLFIIVPAIFGLFTDRDKLGPCIGIAVGVLLLLATRDVITWNMMWQLLLAFMIVAFGLKILFFRNCGHFQKGICEEKTISRDGKNIRRIETSFGKQEINFRGEKFEGADVHTSFGALILDFRGADIAEGAFVDLNVGFAGATIIVPENLAVQIAVSSGFGGVKDDRRYKVTTGSPLLTITGNVGFGGVEIKD